MLSLAKSICQELVSSFCMVTKPSAYRAVDYDFCSNARSKDDLGVVPRPKLGASYSMLVACTSFGKVSTNSCCADCSCFKSLLSNDRRMPVPSFCLVICMSHQGSKSDQMHCTWSNCIDIRGCASHPNVPVPDSCG